MNGISKIYLVLFFAMLMPSLGFQGFLRPIPKDRAISPFAGQRHVSPSQPQYNKGFHPYEPRTFPATSEKIPPVENSVPAAEVEKLRSDVQAVHDLDESQNEVVVKKLDAVQEEILALEKAQEAMTTKPEAELKPPVISEVVPSPPTIPEATPQLNSTTKPEVKKPQTETVVLVKPRAWYSPAKDFFFSLFGALINLPPWERFMYVGIAIFVACIICVLITPLISRMFNKSPKDKNADQAPPKVQPKETQPPPPASASKVSRMEKVPPLGTTILDVPVVHVVAASLLSTPEPTAPPTQSSLSVAADVIPESEILDDTKRTIHREDLKEFSDSHGGIKRFPILLWMYEEKVSIRVTVELKPFFQSPVVWYNNLHSCKWKYRKSCYWASIAAANALLQERLKQKPSSTTP